MIKNIAIAVMIMSWLAIPSANAMTQATGSGSGSTTGTWSGTLYGTGSGSWTGSGTYTPPGVISTGWGSGTGSGGGCTPYCTVPEPGTYMLLGIGFLGIYLARRRK